MAKAVFYDPGRKRWKRIRTLLDALGACITVVIIVFLISVSQSYTLPSLLFQEPKRPFHRIRQEPAKPKPSAHKNRREIKPTNISTGVQDDGWRAAFFVTWDAGAFASFREYHQQIDALFPEWLHVISTDGKIKGLTSDYKLFDVVNDGRIQSPDDKVMPFLKKEGGGTDVFPLVNNYDPVAKVWLANVGGFLKNAESRQSFRTQVLAFLLSDEFKGLSLDFEEIPLDAQPGFLALVTELYSEMHPRGLKLYVNVPVDDKDYDYTALANNSDGLILMNYDEHQNSGRPGPVASQDYFIKNLNDTLKMVPKDKLICAIGNYGYDWTSVQTRSGEAGKIVAARSVSVQEAWLAAAESQETVNTDPDSFNPHIAFLEGKDLRHDVWFLNGVTALNQMRGANRLGVNKFALWRLGAEDRSLWAIWDSPSEAGAENKLTEVPPGQDVDLEGQGEVLHIEQFPKNGIREVKVDPESGLVVESNLKVIPMPYQIFQYGAKKNQVALTFDDGPDPAFTPQILDILKQENASAVFFLIGIQAEKYASITRRIYREGHEIGNHTFTHPDISAIGRRHMELELNLTERFLASELGIKPLYFRPPYSIDQEPDTADQVRPLEIVQDAGYITVGDKIDPNDWHDDPPKPAESITNDVMNQLNKGNIILLHDGGGNRAETVKALPMIIHGLRERGYEIVPVSTLIGKTRAGVMPSITPEEQLAAQINRVAFTLFALLNSFIVLVFFVGDFLMSGRLALVGFGAVLERFLSRGQVDEVGSAYQPTVAVLIPAYNEEKVIERTVRSALASNYPNVKVVVVDDGSTDGTYEIVKSAFAAEIRSRQLVLLTKENSGKASAANYGLENIDAEIFIAIDADTVIAPDAIARMVPHFRNPKVGAIAGNAKVGNRVNIWTRWQALEYITSQNFERRALDLIGAVSVVPGAIGAWRTSAVREVGNYPRDTVAEDADLTMSLLQAGYKVHYEDRALAYTEAPLNASGLMRQRFRWSFGVLQAVWKHRAAFWRGGSLGWVGLPNILIFQMILPLVSPFIDVMFLVGVTSYGVNRYFHPDTTNPADLMRLLLFFSLFLVIDFVASALAFLLERKEARMAEDKWLLLQVWLQRFAYRQLFSLVLFKTLKRAFDGRPFSWDKIERSAALTHGRPIAS